MTFAWVIERDESPPSAPEYFTGNSHPAMRWSNPGDHAAAIRFSRKDDAEKMRLAVDCARPHRVCEHGWDDESQYSQPVRMSDADIDAVMEYVNSGGKSGGLDGLASLRRAVEWGKANGKQNMIVHLSDLSALFDAANL